jgi:TonB family protein
MVTKRSRLSLAALVAVSLIVPAAARAQATPAEAALLERLAAQPADMASYLELAKIYLAARRFDDAEQMLTQALALVRQARTSPIPVAQAAGVLRDRAVSPAASPGQPMAGPVRIGGDVKEPKKIKDVRPVYPEIALAARVQGIVILEIIIDQRGSVSDAQVLRSIPLLDQAAIEAVRQWQFTPTFVNNAPAEVVMTVTVNFTLSH